MTDLAIVDVSNWEVRFPEPGGSDANVWLRDADADEYALFKPVVAKADRRQGEDWAEKVVEQVAGLVGVPSARIRMATRDGVPGLLSYDLAPAGHELQTGAVLIGEIDDRLVPRARERFGHNLANIKSVLAPLHAVATDAVDHLQPGQELDLEPEPDNPVDPDAVLVTHDGTRIGWVPNPLLGYVRAVMSNGDARLTVVRANPRELGHHMRLLVRVEGSLPDGFVVPWRSDLAHHD